MHVFSPSRQSISILLGTIDITPRHEWLGLRLHSEDRPRPRAVDAVSSAALGRRHRNIGPQSNVYLMQNIEGCGAAMWRLVLRSPWLYGTDVTVYERFHSSWESWG
jgi:hypothetical protein